nr:ATP synthase F0 subunit 8 [Orthopagus splendens]
MPQMSPISWITMLIMTNLMMMITLTKLYFNKKLKLTKSKKHMMKKTKTWKW